MSGSALRSGEWMATLVLLPEAFARFLPVYKQNARTEAGSLSLACVS